MKCQNGLSLSRIKGCCLFKLHVLTDLNSKLRLYSSAEADKVLVSEKSVKTSISLTSLAHEASKGDDSVLATSHLAVFVNLNKILDFFFLPVRFQVGWRRDPWQ